MLSLFCCLFLRKNSKCFPQKDAFPHRENRENHWKYCKNFIIFLEKIVDKRRRACYYTLARVGEVCSAHCDDAGDCVEKR